jgi:hypothetical protein
VLLGSLSIREDHKGSREETAVNQELGRSMDEKKPADLAACGFNPIQGELEETGVTIPRCTIAVLFIVLIRDITYGDMANE